MRGIFSGDDTNVPCHYFSVKKILYTFLIALFVFGGTADAAYAASLRLSPASGSYASTRTFTVSVLVSSSDQAINAVSGRITFPTDVLQVVSVSKIGSVISFWVSEPSYSNNSGEVRFEGIVPNPGYTGSGGKIISITFRARTPGNALVRLGSAAVLANDGNGTNVLTDLGHAEFTVTEAPVPEPEPLAPSVPVTPPTATSTDVASSTSTPTTTQPIIVPAVTEPVTRFGMPIGPLTIIIVLLAVICGLLVLATTYLFLMAKHAKNSVHKRTEATEKSLHKAFALLSDDFDNYVKELSNDKTHRMSKSEVAMVKEFQKNISDVEKFLEKKIEEIDL